MEADQNEEKKFWSVSFCCDAAGKFLSKKDHKIIAKKAAAKLRYDSTNPRKTENLSHDFSFWCEKFSSRFWRQFTNRKKLPKTAGQIEKRQL